MDRRSSGWPVVRSPATAYKSSDFAPGPLHLDVPAFQVLLERQGPSLGLWRAAEVAVLRQVQYERPVLDLGCGDGLVTSLVMSRVEVGLDPDENVLKQASLRGIYERFEPVCAEAMQLPAGSIGTVLSNSVLEHLPGLDNVLESVARVLRPGGRLVFTVPTENFSDCLALPFSGYAAWRNSRLAHLNLWSVARWTEQLERVGLEAEDVRTIPAATPGARLGRARTAPADLGWSPPAGRDSVAPHPTRNPRTARSMGRWPRPLISPSWRWTPHHRSQKPSFHELKVS